MARRDDYDERSVWARPVFFVSAVLIVAVLVLGVWLAVANERRDDGGGQGTTAQAGGSGSGAEDAGRADGSGTGAAGSVTDAGVSGTAGPDGPGDADGTGADDDSPGTERGDGVPVGTPSAPPAGDAVAGEPSWCGLGPAVLDGTVTRAPEGVAWELVGSVAAPTLPGTGPGVKDTDGFRACYAQSPTGALLAAANVVAMGSVDALVARTTAELTAAGPGREAALARLAEEEAATSTDAAAAEGTVGDGTATDPAATAPPPPTPALPTAVARYQIRGFHMIDYAGETASVDIALGLDNGALGSFVVDLVWEGDWKVRLTDVGTLPTPPAQIPNLAGYTVWSGA